MTTICFTSVQESLPNNYQGRVHSTFNILGSIISLTVYLSMGFLADVVSIRWLYGLQIIPVVIAVSIASYWFARREPRAVPAGRGVAISDADE